MFDNLPEPVDVLPINVLLIDEAKEGYDLVRDCLDEIVHARFVIDWVQNIDQGLDCLDEGRADVCLIGDSPPGQSGLELLKIAAHRGSSTPMILVSGVPTRDLDLQAMALGAAAFLDKRRLDPQLLE